MEGEKKKGRCERENTSSKTEAQSGGRESDSLKKRKLSKIGCREKHDGGDESNSSKDALEKGSFVAYSVQHNIILGLTDSKLGCEVYKRQSLRCFVGSDH